MRAFREIEAKEAKAKDRPTMMKSPSSTKQNAAGKAGDD